MIATLVFVADLNSPFKTIMKPLLNLLASNFIGQAFFTHSTRRMRKQLFWRVLPNCPAVYAYVSHDNLLVLVCAGASLSGLILMGDKY
jgi:hypothetical protein